MALNKELLSKRCTLSILFMDGTESKKEYVRDVFLIDNKILKFTSEKGIHYIPIEHVYEWNIEI